MKKTNREFGATSRFRLIETVFNPSTKTKYLGSFRGLRERIKFSPNDNFHKVTLADENRLDIISFRYYNTPDLWWVIALANNIANPRRNVTIGTNLRIPAIDQLYRTVLR